MGVVIGDVQMGQREELGGGGTVRIGRRVEAAIGGFCGMVEVDEAFSALDDADGLGLEKVVEVRPDVTGGGSSIPSAALRDSCRAKSDACHHSRNLSAKMEAGRTTRSEDSSFG